MKKITSDIGFTADRGAMIHVFLLCMPSWIDRMGFSLPRPHFQPKSRPGDDKTTDGGNLIAVHHGQVNPFEHFHLYFLFVIFVKDSRHLYIYLLNFLDCRFSFHHFFLSSLYLYIKAVNFSHFVNHLKFRNKIIL